MKFESTAAIVAFADGYWTLMASGPSASGIGGSLGLDGGRGALATAGAGNGTGMGTGATLLPGEQAETMRTATNPDAELFVGSFIDELLRIGGTNNVEQEMTRRKEWPHFLYSRMVRCTA